MWRDASIRFLDWLIAILEGWRAWLEPEEVEEIEESEIEEAEGHEPQVDPLPVVAYPEGAPPPVTEPKREPEYTEPDEPPDGCLRVWYNGSGSVIINDYRGWSVQLKQGENLIITDQTWTNLNDQDLVMTKPGTWEKA